MAPREPRGGSVTSTCDNLRELASAYLPTLRYATGERFFPVRAESWLTHTSSADWPETAGNHGDDLGLDGQRHGTSLIRADPEVTSLSPLGGTPPFDRPLALEPTDTGPNAIATHAAKPDDSFLVFGGWADPEARTQGNEDYLARTFSELGAAMEQKLPWQPVDVDAAAGPHVPTIWIPQPVTPTVYAEVEWTGIFPTWAAEQSLDDFAPEPGGGRLTELDTFLSLTYYYLYALRHPVDDGAPTRLEGQWEAASLLFRAKPVGSRPDGRPAEMEILETPEWVVVSQGLDGGVHRVRSATWDEVTKVQIDVGTPGSPQLVDSTSCLLFVGRGTHVFHFEPQDGHDWEQPPPGSDLDLDLTEDSHWLRYLVALVWLILCALAVWAVVELFILALTLFVIGALGLAALAFLAAFLLALIALALLVLFILFLLIALEDEGSDAQPHPQNEEASGDGPEAGSDEAPAGDPHGDVTGAGGATAPGTPNAGSPTGRDIAAFDLRVVDVFNHPDEQTGFPPARACEHPTWWSYTGGWGVRVPARLSSGWTNGMRRVDNQGRSWSYFAAAEVARRIDAD